jgi:hypothetical protein
MASLHDIYATKGNVSVVFHAVFIGSYCREAPRRRMIPVNQAIN